MLLNRCILRIFQIIRMALMLLLTFLAAIPNHRRPQGRRYGVEHVSLFSILAILSDATSYRKIQRFIGLATAVERPLWAALEASASPYRDPLHLAGVRPGRC